MKPFCYPEPYPQPLHLFKVPGQQSGSGGKGHLLPDNLYSVAQSRVMEVEN